MNRTHSRHVASLIHPAAVLFFSAVVFPQEKDADSLAAPVVPISRPGSIDRRIAPDHVSTDTAARWNEYVHLNDIVAAQTGGFVRELGSAGQFSGLTVGGLDGRGVLFMQDGIPMNEPLTGLYNSPWYQTEQIDRVEIETGPRAFLYGYNSTGGAINVVTRSYRAIRPYTHIRYSESRYEQTTFDGLVSQNLTRTLNVTAGVQRHVTDGRFTNSDYDAWGARLRARFDLSSRLNLVFTETYTQTQLGLFGGIDYGLTSPDKLFDRLQATVVSGDSYEKITRHDLQLGAAAQLFDDSSHITTLTAYYSAHLREFRNEENRPDPDSLFIQDDHRSRRTGVRVTQHFGIGSQSLDLGAEVQSLQIIESPATGYRANVAVGAFGKVESEPVDGLHLAAYARIDRSVTGTPLSFGADAALRPVDGMTLFAGYSRSARFPTFQELYWHGHGIDGRESFGHERHDYAEAGVSVAADNVFHLRAKAFQRTVRNMILADSAMNRPFSGVTFLQSDNQSFRGIEASAALRVWRFLAEGSAQYLYLKPEQIVVGGATKSVRAIIIPDWWASGGIYFRDRLASDHLDLKLGVRGRVWSQQQGMEFNPEAMMFVPSSLPPLGLATVVDGVLVAHIGDAYVHFIWENLFDNDYAITPFYPMPDRALRFGVSWDLFD